jgi:ligand-binding sensor domain-containing protein
VLWPSYSFTQFERKDFEIYTYEDGLSDNFITAISQDDQGFIWIGTQNGLNRFDGNSFEKYYQGMPENFLTSSYITNLKPLSGHRLMISTRLGAQIINTDDYSVRHFLVPDSTSFTTYTNGVIDALELKDKSVLLSNAAGIYHFDSTGALLFRHDMYYIDDVGKKLIRYGRNMFNLSDDEVLIYVEEDKQGLYHTKHESFREFSKEDLQHNVFCNPSYLKHWVAKFQISDHEYILLPREDSIIYYDYLRHKRIASPLPYLWKIAYSWSSQISMLDSTTFILTGGNTFGYHLFNINRQTGIIQCDPETYLGHIQILCCLLDHENRLWLGTAGRGLYRQKLKLKPIESFFLPIPAKQISPGEYVGALRHKGKLYLPTNSNDYGLTIVDSTTMQIDKRIQFFGPDNTWNRSVSMQMYYPDTLWIGSMSGLLWFDTRSSHYGKVEWHGVDPILSSFAVLAPKRKDGYAWMCQYLKGVIGKYHVPSHSLQYFDINTEPAVPFQRIKHITYDSYGDVWFGGSLLTRWNEMMNKFDTVITTFGGPNKFNNNILVLTHDEAGSLWLHNGGNGLLQYKIKSHEWHHYGMESGMLSEVIYSLSPLIHSAFWIADPNHLIHFDTRTAAMQFFDRTDGIPDAYPDNTYMYHDEAARQVYAFYEENIIRFPEDFHTTTSAIGEIVFPEIAVINGRKINFPHFEQHFEAFEKNLVIQYTVVDFEYGNQYKFSYRLNRLDPWVNMDNQRTIRLINLSPGDYFLEIKASSKSGQIKTGKLAFSVAPPFWKTSWFLILAAILLVTGSWLIYKRRIAQFKIKADLDKLLSQTEMKALHAQMNPHFIFNSLNSIREMILNNENKEASRYLSKFAHLIRVTLDQSGQSFISLRHSIDYLQRYIEMEKIRNGHFNCTIRVDPLLEPDETILPPMLIQPFIENAIWHGSSGDHRQIDIQVQFNKCNDHLECVVDDNGIGIDQSMNKKNVSDPTHHPVGISNIRSRIQLLNKKHNLQSSVTVEDKSKIAGHTETGTRVTLRLPLEIIET